MTEFEDPELARRVADDYRKSTPPDPRAKERLLERIRAEALARRSSAPLDWLFQPAEIRVRPAVAIAAGLALVMIGALLVAGGRPQRAGEPRERAAAGVDAPGGALQVVRFVLVAPNASRVVLVGDFNGWDPQAAPMKRVKENGGGDTWTIAVPVSPGRHVYAFVVDGKNWVPDPMAPLAPEDGFGVRNSVLVVGGPEST